MTWASLSFGGGAPQSRDLNGEVLTEKGEPIPGAICTLAGGLLPERGVSATTGEKGRFEFQGILAGHYTLTCVSVGFEPLVKEDMEVGAADVPFIQMVLTPEVVVKQTIEVKENASSVVQESATPPPARIAAPQLTALPLVEQKFKAALPLVPGVVRTPDGKLSIKGTVETQGLMLVNGAEAVDPVTGSYSIGVPLDAVQTVDVYKAAYKAEFGGFTGGLTTVDTKPPSEKLHWELNDFIPTPRIENGSIVGIQDDEPRLYLTGPLIENKLTFLGNVLYEFSRQPVRGLPWPNNETITEGVNAFLAFQYIVSSQHLLTVSSAIFPTRQQFANINALVPQTASSDYGQSGYFLGGNDRYVFHSGGLLSTLFQYTDFDSYGHGNGSVDMLVTPNGWSGNFFNRYSRESNQEEFEQAYQLPHREYKGRHELKVGWQFTRRAYIGTNQSHPVLVQRNDGTTAEQITFTGAGNLNVTDVEVAGFLQDHWVLNEHVAADAGVRFSSQTLGNPFTVAPRGGLTVSPGKSGRTIMRAGLGIFYDREPLLAGDWIQNPTRVVTLYDLNGQPLGPPVPFPNLYIRVGENGQSNIPSHNRLDSTPYNLTWSTELDQELKPQAVLRFEYLSSRTFSEFIVNPSELPMIGPAMLLSNTGNARYQEFNATLRLRPAETADIRFSYVYSQTRGDLNTLTPLFVPFQEPIIRPNFFGELPADIPNRFVAWGTLKLPWAFTLGPIYDAHSGFPYSYVDALQDYVGTPNSHRYPTFTALDLRINKDFTFQHSLAKDHKFRVGLFVYNVFNHQNPRNVYNNTTSPYFNHFVGILHRSYNASFDIVY
jgi:hypothetical protein